MVRLLAIAAVVAGAVAPAAAAQPPTRTPGQLVVGLHLPSPRFQTGTLDRPRGLEADLARALARRFGLEVTFRQVPHRAGLFSPGPKPWDLALARVKTGASLSIPYLAADQGVLLRRGLRPAPRSLAELRWLTECAVAGTTGAELPGRPALVKDDAALDRALRSGRCDAALGDAPGLAALRAVRPGSYGPLVGTIRTGERYALVLPTGSALKPFVDRELRRLLARRTVGAIVRKWLHVDLARLRPLPRTAGTTRVTLIGDSVAAALNWTPEARPILERRLDVRWEAVACRRLVAPSCREWAPTALSTVRRMGRALGPIVVVDVGYNDDVRAYGMDLARMMRGLVAAGVRRVVWVTLREAGGAYRLSNAAIRAARQQWPQLVVADWDRYSRGRPWFASDGLHLNAEGAFALVRMLEPIVATEAGLAARAYDLAT